MINIVIDYTIFKRYQNNLKISDTWKIQLTIANKFIPSIDNEEEPVMHWKSDNIEIMSSDEVDEVVTERLIHLKIDIKIISNQLKVAVLSLIMFSYCIINITK